MGAMQNASRTPGKGSKSRGSVKNTSRLDAFTQRGGSGSADWGNCIPERVQAVVVAITSLGGAITFGLSRDMGAHSLTLMLDDTRETLWYNGDADLDEALALVVEMLGAVD